jgi:hypothetical protein
MTTTASAPAGARLTTQPALGLAGITLVVPVAVLLAIGAGGPEPSLLVLAPLVTFGLPVVAMIAFWWDDWPGSRLRPGFSGMFDTLLVILGAVALTMVGQSIAGHLDLRGIFDPTPGPGHAPTSPATLALGGAAFVAMLQITLVCDRWPLQRVDPYLGGVIALVAAWAIALVLYFALLDFGPPAGSGLRERSGPLEGAELGSLLVLVGAWQVWFYVGWRGWPFTAIARRGPRLLVGNAVVIGGAVATYGLLHGVASVRAPAITAVAGTAIAAWLLTGMLFESLLWIRGPAARRRMAITAATAVLAVVLYLLLRTYADGVDWTRGSREDWIVGVILHVAIGRRFPFAARP